MKQQNNEKLTYIPLNDTKNYFYSSDLGLVASLLSIGFQLISIDKEHPSKALFIVKKEYNLEEMINGYFSGQLMAPARVLFDKVKLLKSMLHNIL